MTDIPPGWYRDPVDPAIQRYWDGEEYVGDPIPAEATPPSTPPVGAAAAALERAAASERAAARERAAALERIAAAERTATAPPAGPPEQVQPAEQAQPAEHAEPTEVAEPAVPVSAGVEDLVTPVRTPAAAARSAGAPVVPTPGGLPPGTWPAYPKLVLPPPKPHGFPLAGLGARFIARMIDTLAVLGLNVAVNGWFVYQWIKVNQPYWDEVSRRFYAGQSTADVQPPEQNSQLVIIILLLAALLWFAYEVPSLANSGQTLGKRLTGIKVVPLEADEELGFRRSIRRWNTLGLPTLLWTCFGVGFLLQLVDCLWAALDRPLRQALHDKSALTVVVFVGHSTPQRGGSA